jgi:hypothetical protein
MLSDREMQDVFSIQDDSGLIVRHANLYGSWGRKVSSALKCLQAGIAGGATARPIDHADCHMGGRSRRQLGSNATDVLPEAVSMEMLDRPHARLP